MTSWLQFSVDNLPTVEGSTQLTSIRNLTGFDWAGRGIVPLPHGFHPQKEPERHIDARGPADLIMLLARETEAQPVHAFAIAAAGDNAVDALLIPRIDRIEGLAAVVEIELVRARIGKRGREISLEG